MRALVFIACILPYFVFAQFDGPGGTSGSKSIHKDDNAIISWANHCEVERGWLNIADTSKGRVNHGIDSNALGLADGQVVSLGDGGVATIEFDDPIVNNGGYDLAVFENGFKVGLSYYLELAHVEVSHDGVTYYRFPSETTIDTSFQTDNFFYTKPEEVYNLAGKHQAPYGTLFDLEEVGLDSAYFVRVIDVIGSIDSNYGSFDSKGRIINDPYPSEFPSGGFDLDAVASLNGGILSSREFVTKKVVMFPNPASSNQTVYLNEYADEILITTINGQLVFETSQSVNQFTVQHSGVYIVKITKDGIVTHQRLCIN